MKAYIVQNKDGEFTSVNFAVAYDGFRKMGRISSPSVG